MREELTSGGKRGTTLRVELRGLRRCGGAIKVLHTRHETLLMELSGPAVSISPIALTEARKARSELLREDTVTEVKRVHYSRSPCCRIEY